MAALLISRWTDGLDPIAVEDQASISLCRERLRERATSVGLPLPIVAELATLVTELAQNQLHHAGGGELDVTAIERGGLAGIEVVAADSGSGIRDPTRALAGIKEPKGPISKSLGIGLSVVRRFADELDLDVRFGEGTCVRARRFVQPPARPSEVAILARSCQGESVIGDDGLFVRTGERLLLAIADGLGHGPAARDASGQAMDEILKRRTQSVSTLLQACQSRLRSTRGAVLAIAECSNSEVHHAAVGDTSTLLWRHQQTRRLPSRSGVVGQHGAISLGRSLGETAQTTAGELVLIHTDGLSSRIDLNDHADVMRSHPMVIAQALLEAHGRRDDDALILVARH